MRFDIKAEITYSPTRKGNLRDPVAFSGCRPLFYYDGGHWSTIHAYPEVDYVYPGQTVTALIAFLSPNAHIGKLYPGKNFQVRQGQQVLGHGVVTKINLALDGLFEVKWMM